MLGRTYNKQLKRQEATEVDITIADRLLEKGEIAARAYKCWYAASVSDKDGRTPSVRRIGQSYNLNAMSTMIAINKVWLAIGLEKQILYPKDDREDIPLEFRIHRHSGADEIISPDSTAIRANRRFPAEEEEGKEGAHEGTQDRQSGKDREQEGTHEAG